MPSTDGLPTDTDVGVIGSGFAGIGMGIKLKEAGRHDFVILEKAADLGGTWRDNDYPGCTCDVPSFLYSFSYEQNPSWSRMFSPRDEIWAYLERCADTYGLRQHLQFSAEVTGAVYDESTGRWQVEVNGSDVIDARVVVSGVGALHIPKTPALAGIESFEGESFHSARWRNDVELDGRDVAVIGTGASSIQFVPAIAPRVRQLSVYQRTAPWITPKPDRPIGAREQRLYARYPVMQRAVRAGLYWAMEARGAGFAMTPRAMGWLERGSRRYLERKVPDPDLRAKLTPDYQIGCKRVLLTRDYLPAVQRDNVELVTTPIAQVGPHGIVDADGIERPADVIVFGTGFEVPGSLMHMKVVGRDGAVLNDLWTHDGAAAHLGMAVSGFPNLFLLLGPNTGLGHTSVVFMIESQIRYIVQALDLMDDTCAAGIEVRADVQDRFVERVRAKLAGSVWQSGCSSWYQDDRGRNIAIWPHFTWKYWLDTRRINPADYRLVRVASRSDV
ncbi:MAG TPA: NAD(P)/FAD-dependent oxidoreductase [Nocardioidaceae bacterium]|nr:NAD(P)/FAD-dependent oxidoreductase [Nocardioidaceae bacterium]